MLRIVHTADWHLGKTLDDRDRDTEHGMFLDFLLEKIVAMEIDVLLICGDLFDSANPPQRAMARYYHFLSSLRNRSACRVIIIAGNHDSPALLEAPHALLEAMDIHVVGRFSPELQCIPLPNEKNPLLYVAPVPFLRDADLRTGVSGQSISEIQHELNEGIVQAYQIFCRQSIIPVLAMGHFTMIGSVKSSSEREIHIGGLGAMPVVKFPESFCYVALGHLHRPQSCGGREHIRYSGSPIALSFSEADDRKELRILELDNAGLRKQEALSVPDFRRLIRMECSILDASLWIGLIKEELAKRPSILPAWVEVQLTRTYADVEIRKVLEVIGDQPDFEITRIIPLDHLGIQQSIECDDEAATMMATIDDPIRMFEKRIKQAQLDESQSTVLRQLFQQLLENHQQSSE